MAADRGLHVEGGVARADGMVLMRHGRTEQGHDPVAHDLVDGPLVAVDRLHHPLEDGIEQLPSFLEVPVGQQFHRALQVRKQHGHLLALALEGGPRGQDLLGQVLRGVALGCAESRARRRLRGLALTEPLTALLAKLGARLSRGAATGAGGRVHDMLTREQVQSYRRDGYLLVENVLSPRELATLRQVTDELVAASHAVTENDRVYDLEPTHTPRAPRVRRIKETPAS